MALGTFKNFGNNLLLERFDYRMAGNFTDENKIMNLLSGTEATNRVHLGLLSLFNQMQLVNTPLLNMTELAGNTLYVNGDEGEFTFDVPYTLEMPTIREDLSGSNPKVGQDGQWFEVIIGDGNTDPIFSKTENIKADLRDGQQFEILEVGNRVSGGFVYKLKLVTNDKFEYVDKRQLTVGTQYFSLGTVTGAYDEHFSGINQSAGSMRLLHRIGSRTGVEMTLTGGAQRLKIDGLNNVDNNFAATVAPYLDPKNPDFMKMVGYNNGQGKIDKAKGVSLIPMYEILLYKQLMMNTEKRLMWGNGGVSQDQRNNFKYSAEGFYNQLKYGNFLRIAKYTKDIIIGVLSQVYKNRPDIPDTERFIEFQGGRGAVIELTRIFAQEGALIANALGLVLGNNSVNVIKGSDSMNLEAGYRFTKVFFSGFGHVSIKHNPALDSEYNRYMDEQKVGGLPKFSYTAMVLDVTDQAATNAFKPSKQVTFAKGFDNQANVYLVKNSGMPGVKYTYINGRTSTHPVNVGKGTLASSRFDGETIILEEQSSVWLRDPGRTVLLQLK